MYIGIPTILVLTSSLFLVSSYTRRHRLICHILPFRIYDMGRCNNRRVEEEAASRNAVPSRARAPEKDGRGGGVFAFKVVLSLRAAF